jgi:hypothetical protein
VRTEFRLGFASKREDREVVRGGAAANLSLRVPEMEWHWATDSLLMAPEPILGLRRNDFSEVGLMERVDGRQATQDNGGRQMNQERRKSVSFVKRTTNWRHQLIQR